MTTIEIQLERFMKEYHSIRVNVRADCLIYSCNRGLSDKAVIAANGVIEKMGLDLYAIGTKFPAKDSYTIQSIFSEI